MPDRPADGLPLPAVERAPAARPRRGRALVLLSLSVLLAGALTAGLVWPVVGGAVLASRTTAEVFRPVEADLLDRTPAGNTRILAADGSLVAELYRRNRTVVPGEAIAPVMKDALVAIEDARFYEHGGVDGKGLTRALVTNLAAGTVVQGGSTLTQQLIKQIRLQTAEDPDARAGATEQSVGRKLREAQLALGLETRYTKDEILTRYLNRVYFGAGAYGVAAAAETYFDVPPDALTLAQAATLAGLVQSPTTYDPLVAPERATERRDVVLARMVELGTVEQQEADAARAEPVAVQPGAGPPRGCREATVGGFFCDYVLQYLTGELGLSRELVETGGLTVRTTLDPAMQRTGDTAVRGTLALEDPRAGIYTAVEPGTGRVLAMSVNRVFGAAEGDPTRTSVNLPLVAGQGAGSIYKTFTAAAAMEQGFGLDYRITTPDPYVSRIYRDGDGPYDVQNAGSFPRTLTMEEALYRSSNTYFLALEDQLGSVEGPVRMAQRLGLTSLDPVADAIVAENRGSFTFGAEATSPLALANSYATLASGGLRCAPTPVDEVLDRDGRPLTDADGQPLGGSRSCEQAVPVGLANTLSQALRKDVEPGYPGQTGRRAYVPGHQIAGKTGTTQNNYSIGFVGFTPQISASVMVYDPVTNRDVGGSGGGTAAQIWHDSLAPILSTRPVAAFAPADPRYVEGTRRTVPGGCVGSGEFGCRNLLLGRGLSADVVRVDSSRRPGIVVGVRPGAGAVVSTDQPVTVLVSNGSSWTPPVPEPEPQPQPQPAPEPEPQPQPQPAPEPEPAPRPQPAPEPQPEPQPAPQPERAPEAQQPAAEPDTEPQAEPAAQPDARPEPAAEPDARPAPGPDPEDEPEPDLEPAPDAGAEAPPARPTSD